MMLSPPPNHRGRKQIKVGAITYAQLIFHMLEGIHNCQELADLTGLHYVTVLQYTREMHAAGAVHICAWEKDGRGRDSIKVYKIGKGRDKKREKMTSAERQARHRSKANHIGLIGATAGKLADRSLEQAFGVGT